MRLIGYAGARSETKRNDVTRRDHPQRLIVAYGVAVVPSEREHEKGRRQNGEQGWSEAPKGETDAGLGRAHGCPKGLRDLLVRELVEKRERERLTLGGWERVDRPIFAKRAGPWFSNKNLITPDDTNTHPRAKRTRRGAREGWPTFGRRRNAAKRPARTETGTGWGWFMIPLHAAKRRRFVSSSCTSIRARPRSLAPSVA